MLCQGNAMHMEYTKARTFKYQMLFNDVVALVLVFKIQAFVGLKTESKHQNTNKLINRITKSFIFKSGRPK